MSISRLLAAPLAVLACAPPVVSRAQGTCPTCPLKGGAGAPDACEPAKKAYHAALASLPRECAKSSDCAVSRLDWNPCIPEHAFNASKADGAAIASVRAALETGRRACGYVFPPCAHIPTQAACYHGTCRTLHQLLGAPLKGLSLRLVGGKKGRPLKNLEFDLRWMPADPFGGRSPEVAAPLNGPSGQKPARTDRLRTDARGLLSIPKPDGWYDAELETGGYAPVRLTLPELLEKDGSELRLQRAAKP